MSLTLDCPLIGLETTFPETLYISKHKPTSKYACYSVDGVHGLACFSTQIAAAQFSSEIEGGMMEVVEVSFDEAREIAKERPMPVVSLMLLDDLNDPQIHYVR